MSGSDVPRLMDYIDHIVEAISRIIKYVEDIDEQAFVRDHMIQDAVIRNFEIIGEGAIIHWPDLDEDVSVENILFGRPSQESQESFRRWLEARSE